MGLLVLQTWGHVETGAGNLMTECSRPEGARLGSLGVRIPPSTLAQSRPSSRRMAAPSSSLALRLLIVCTSPTLYSFFPSGCTQRQSQAPKGGGGGEQETLSPWGKPSSCERHQRPLRCSLPPRAPEGLQRRRLERAAGARNNRQRPRRGAECTQAKWPTPGQVALQVGPVFTCLLSQVAQTRTPFRSSGAWGRLWCAVGSQLLTSPHRDFPPPVGGGVGSERQQTRPDRKILWEREERPGHTPVLGAWLGGPAGAGGVLRWNAAPPPTSLPRFWAAGPLGRRSAHTLPFSCWWKVAG